MKPALSLWRHPVLLLAFGLGSGLAPRAPGTFGTLAAWPFAVWLAQYSPVTGALVIVVSFVVGVGVCSYAARRLGVHDHPGIVWDEFVGFWVTCWCLPAGWPWWVVAFALFRFFDIAKPWPIRWLDRQVGGGFGIMADDLLAGVMAWGLLQVAAAVLGVSVLAWPGV